MTTPADIIEADLTWTGASFERGVQVVVGADGRIASVGADAGQPTRRLAGRALLPGMINAHSHAFQRGLRGRGEQFPDGGGSFWTWREEMYGLVERMDERGLRDLCMSAFGEMLAAGITTVGEFHYLHHDASCAGFAFDEVVLRAAAEAGIRLVLLNAYYNTGGIGAPLAGGQTRFRASDPDEYWRRMELLAAGLDGRRLSLGAVVHSIRAAALDDIVSIHREAAHRGMVFHMHVEEQVKEIEACVEAYGAPPMAVLADRLDLGPGFTAVHCTHTRPTDLARFLDAGGHACICPLTEGNLGDGIAGLGAHGGEAHRICLGTDSNARICFTEEMRWLEYVQRLHGQKRGVFRDASGGSAAALWRAATVNGAASLGIEAGEIRTGAEADFIALDLDAPVLDGWTEETLLDAFVFGSGNEAIGEVCVGGRWVS